MTGWIKHCLKQGNMEDKKITVTATISAPIEKVWENWTMPNHIEKWAFASDDWEAVDAENNLETGGNFKTRMQSKDKSVGFDFEGTYTAIEENKLIEYDMSDGRHVKIEFEETPEGVKVTETFDPENENPIGMQKDGWQAILNNFKKYTESK